MKKYLFYIILFCVVCPVYGQQEISVVDFSLNSKDIAARTNRRDDVSGVPCALIKVQFPMNGANFIGNIVGSVTKKTNEYWVYMPQNSNSLEVRLANYMPLVINFNQVGIGKVESNCTYDLCLLAKEKGASKLYEDGMIALAKGNIVEAYDNLAKAADAGYSKAYYILGCESITSYDVNYESDPNDEDSYKEAYNYYKKGADKGLPEAQYALAKMLLDFKEYKNYGDDFPSNLTKMKVSSEMLSDNTIWSLLENAANSGNADAQWMMISNEKWCKENAGKGNAIAEFGMGLWCDDMEAMCSADYLHNWEGLLSEIKNKIKAAKDREINVEKACLWYKKAASKKIDLAMWMLADRCQEGIGTTKDISQAIALRKDVAEMGNINCQLYLAHTFCFGVMAQYYDDGGWGDHAVEIKEDLKEASRWLRKVSNQNMNQLVELSRYAGSSIESDFNEFAYRFNEAGDRQEAVYWWQRAAEWGSESAIDKLTEIGMSIPKKLIPDE